jgi:hypothetical protein
MTLEQIIALLVAKFQGVRKDGLAQVARTIALQATTEDEAKAIIDKLDVEKVKAVVTDYRKDVDKEVSEANKTYEGTLKKKFDFVEKKSNPDDDDSTKKPLNDDAPAWAKALIDQNKALADKLNAIEGQKVTDTRLQMLEGKFAGVPDSYKSQRLADAKLFINNLDEAGFNEYLTKTESDIAAFNQELADKGLSGQGKPMFGQKDNNGISSGVAAFIDSQTKDKAPLMGKEI